MTDYFIDDRTMTVLADEARRLSGSTDALNGAEILETLSKVQGNVVEGTQYTIEVLDHIGIVRESKKCDAGTIYALPKASEYPDSNMFKFQRWAAPADTTGGFIKVKHPMQIGALVDTIDGSVKMTIKINANNTTVTLGYMLSYIARIDWGDSEIDDWDKIINNSTGNNDDGKFTHTYSSSGYYTISCYSDPTKWGYTDDYRPSERLGAIQPYPSDDYTITSLSVPSNITEILPNAFTNLTGLLELTLADGVQRVYGLGTLSNLSQLILPRSINYISTSSSDSLASLYTIVLEEGITDMVGGLGDSNITLLVCPSTQSTGGSGMAKLRTAILTGQSEYFPNFSESPMLENIVVTYDGGVIPLRNSLHFDNSFSLKSIYVPDELVDSYKTTDRWKNFDEFIKPLSKYTE